MKTDNIFPANVMTNKPKRVMIVQNLKWKKEKENNDTD